MHVEHSLLSNWMPQPGLNRSIKRFFERFASQDGTFWSSYCRDAIFSKYAEPDEKSAELRASAAYKKLWATEERNAATNHRLRNTREFQSIIFTAKQRISYVLGDCDLNLIYPYFDFSNGASQRLSRKESNKFNKFNSRSYVTESCLPYLDALYKSSELLSRDVSRDCIAQRDIQTAYGNTLFTVPKNDTIDRVCAKEPDWNMFFQKGFGGYIRHRLKAKANIDLNDQGVNRSLAREGSIKNNLATLDLSAASDSISSELVYMLLPGDWFKHLDNVRSKQTRIDNKLHSWQLFSTMGNGFTFELESLIFYAIAWSICYLKGIKGSLSVYGDDIICPSAAASELIAVLSYLGFDINNEKTFIEGPFRESCGGHYYNGLDVTPIYIKKPIRTLPEFILFRNKFYKWATNNYLNPIVDPRCREFLSALDYQLKDFGCLCSPYYDQTIPSTTIIANCFGGSRLREKTGRKRFDSQSAYNYWHFKREHTNEYESVVSKSTGKLYIAKNRENSAVNRQVLWVFNP